jgi:CheY-like chemotaxis protein
VANPVERCASGEEVGQFLARMDHAPAAEIPVFVFLDLNLPGAHGAEVLGRLKSHEALAATPVVVLTTSSHVKDVDLSYELGAAGFLTKPLDLDKFEKMIQRVAAYWFTCVKLPEHASRLR